MRYNDHVTLIPPFSDSSDDDAEERLTSLLLASEENIAPSSFDHLVLLTRKVMQCSKAVVILGGTIDPDEGDVALIPADPGIRSALVRLAIESDEAIVISDVPADARFVDDPLVVSGPRIGYFATAPLLTADGERVGTLCAVDESPRKRLRSNEIDAMDALAGAIVSDMALDQSRMELVLQNSELRRMQDVQVLKDEFVATVSHELRTPLTSITASLGLLEDGILGELSEDVAGVVKVAAANSARLIALVDDLLDLERIEAGGIDLVVAPTLVNEIIDTALIAVQGSAMKSSIGLVREDRFDAGLQIDCDASRVVQVLVNLLGNAVKFSDSGSTVTLRTEVAYGNGIVFSVVDWGRGIPAESMANLFDPFWQDDSSASRRVGGSGLGLAISKKIVEQHRGHIEVDSTPGIGSTFRVVLPVHEVTTPE